MGGIQTCTCDKLLAASPAEKAHRDGGPQSGQFQAPLSWGSLVIVAVGQLNINSTREGR